MYLWSSLFKRVCNSVCFSFVCPQCSIHCTSDLYNRRRTFWYTTLLALTLLALTLLALTLLALTLLALTLLALGTCLAWRTRLLFL